MGKPGQNPGPRRRHRIFAAPQALEQDAIKACRDRGSLKTTAEALGITPAAVGQPIRALDRVTGKLDFHRVREIHIVADPGWANWFKEYGHRETGVDRGVHYKNARLALEAVRLNVGFFVGGLSLLEQDLQAGTIVLPFPINQYLIAPHPYRLRISPNVEQRPQMQRFLTWLRETASETKSMLDRTIQGRLGT